MSSDHNNEDHHSDEHIVDAILEHEQYQISPYLIGAARALPRMLVKQRAVAYTSEIGEAGRSVFKPWMVKTAYALSFAYVLADTGLKMSEEYEIEKDTKRTVLTGAYMMVFHGLASLYLPAVMIHSIVKYSKLMLLKWKWSASRPPVRGWVPSLIGLASIPLIVAPIDYGVEYALEKSLYPLFFGEEPHHHD
eukprot:TRINITY_DN11829_c0_g1_i1.p1 TRINITY_DN11829_c0_g1~~TRINITY_DN11829_c0_g1_i1.p1  ORF type:complete len:192 (+),score=11.86 TRINITY_DN11829_c0_g1_i1:350-925(+)